LVVPCRAILDGDTGRKTPGIAVTVFTMTTINTVRLASVRVITRNVPRAVAFYEVLTGATPNHLTEDFVELVTPSATLAVSDASRLPLIADGNDTPSAALKDGSIVEFWVDDAEALFATLKATYGEELDVVQAPTMMGWGNVSILIRDPDGLLINLYTPVTPHARQLQQNRTPKLLPPTR
jgi:catechol 2,3-dioxygenase-like lactoylglutathione lyase family enzyme